MLNLNLERYGRFFVDGVEQEKIAIGDGVTERAVNAATEKAASVEIKPTRVAGGDDVTYPVFSPSTVLPSLKAFGATPVKRKAEALWGRYVPCDGITNASGTSIDTGIKAQDNMEMFIRFKALTGSFYILQSREHGSAPIYGVTGSSTNDTILFFGITSSITRTDGHIYTVKGTYANGAVTLYVKDETTGTEDTKTGTTSAYNFPSPTTIKLFGDANKLSAGATVYRAYIKINGKMAWDMYPAVDVNNSNAPVVYDDVTRNASAVLSGSIAGGALIQPVTYLKSTGTQYIDTGVVMSNSISFIGKLGTNTANKVGLSADNVGLIVWNIISNFQKITWRYKDASNATKSINRNFEYEINKLYDIKYNVNNQFVINNDITNKTEAISDNYTSNIRTGTDDLIGPLTFYNNGVMIKDFMPIRIGTTAYMLDLVEWKLYANAGTGAFTYGADIPYAQLQPDIITVNTGDIQYGQYGKNLFDKTTMGTTTGVSLAPDHGADKIWYNGSASFSVVCPVKPNTDYVVTFLGDTVGGLIFRAAATKDLVTSEYSSENPYTANAVVRNTTDIPISINTGDGGKYLYIQCSSAQAGAAKNAIMISEGTAIPTEYEPYKYGIHADGSHTLTVRGKNLFDFETAYSDTSKFTITGTTIRGTATSFNQNPITIPAELIGKTLTFSAMIRCIQGTSTTLNARVTAIINGAGYEGVKINGDTFQLSSTTFTVATAQDTIKVTFGSVGAGILEVKDMQLVEGSTAPTEYSPFIPPISRDIPTLYSADSFVDTQLDSNNKSEAWACIWYDGTQTVPSGYISQTGDLTPNQIVLYPLATPAVTTHAIDKVELTQKATYTVTAEAEMPVDVQATYLGV